MGDGITDVERGVSVAPKGLASGEAWLAMVERMMQIVTGGQRWDYSVRHDVEKDIEESRRTGITPRQMLEGRRQFSTDTERLYYLRFLLEYEIEGGGWIQLGIYYRGPKDPARIAAAMADYEIKRLQSVAEQAVPVPPPLQRQRSVRGLDTDWERGAAQREREEYEAFLIEVARQESADEARSRDLQARYGGRTGTKSMLDYYVGDPVVYAADRAIKAVPGMVSLALDFVPVVGQLKAALEAISGRDLITGRHLADWERGLNILLSVLPSAKAAFRGGKAGLAALAKATAQSGKPAAEVYRAAKGASRLTDAEVKAAKVLRNGKPVNAAAFDKVAGSIDEMMGTPKVGRTEMYRVAAGEIHDGRMVTSSIASSPVSVPPKPVGRPVTPTRTTPRVATTLANAGVLPEAIAALNRAGVAVNKVSRFLTTPRVRDFVNTFHQSPGFHLIVEDLAKGATKKKGALFIIDFVNDAKNKIDPKLAMFEMDVGITKSPLRDRSARVTDLVVTQGGRALNYEFKAYSMASLNKALADPQKILQLVKDVAIHGRRNIKWVFDSAEISESYLHKKFTAIINADPFLKSRFSGKADELEAMLDELLILYPKK
ncbi:MAG TPA: pre-toxin TG domain-containing protein [Thermoanaerobaculia bacterium]